MTEKNQDLVRNRRSFHDYEILETFEAGIVLQGTEIKSLRTNDASIQEAYVKVIEGEAWLVGCYIAPYKYGNVHNHEERRDRKLLFHKYEIRKLKEATREKGLTLVPLAIYLHKGRAKIKVGLAKGKKAYDKRHSIREKEEKRAMDRSRKGSL
jgi:SsrA-binding protein